MPTLAAAEERWRLTIDNAPVGIALVSLDGRWLRVNEALCQILRRPAAELERLTFQDLTHPEDLESDLELLAQLLDGSIPRYRMNKRYLAPDGSVIWTELSVSLARNAAGKPLHFVSHVADRSDEIAAAERIEQMNRDLQDQKSMLERSNADLEAFAVLASHDLQAPLTAMRGYLELLRTEYGDALDTQANEWLERSAQAVERMATLLGSVLDFSVSGHERAAVDDVSITALVRDVSHDLAPLISESAAVVEVRPGPARVRGNELRLRQVLQNLVQNSVKYRHPGRAPHVVVDVEERPEGWLVTVSDNASGIPEDQKALVFGMFRRGEQSEGERPGYGIGLAASRRIVERHGGTIWVEDNPGGGSRFCFTLPR